MTIGQAIKEARRKKGLTQKQLSEKIGYSRTYLADLEGDRYNPSWEIVQKLAKELKLNLNSLVK